MQKNRLAAYLIALSLVAAVPSSASAWDDSAHGNPWTRLRHFISRLFRIAPTDNPEPPKP
jgi:hypothetical protein